VTLTGYVPTTRDVLLGLLLHVLLGEFLGYGSILPLAILPISFLTGGHAAPLLDAYAWELVILALLVPYLSRRDLRGPAALWLERIDWPRLATLAVLAYLAILIGDMVLDDLWPTPNTTPDDDISADFDRLRPDPLAFAGYAACITVVGPVVEELVFRGLFYAHIRARLGAPLTIAITGSLFGLLHGGPPSYALSIVLTGIVLGCLREWTGGVATPIAAHILNNMIASLGDFDLS
jgi:membrane protease YdiL (CAAX protease family)